MRPTITNINGQIILDKTVTGSGTQSSSFTLRASSFLLGVEVSSNSGTLTISAKTYLTSGIYTEVISHDIVGNPGEIVFLKAPHSVDSVDVTVTHSSDASFRVVAKGLDSSVSTLVDKDTGVGVDINASGQMHVVLRGDVCTHCSSSTPLGAGETFTGTATDILDYAIITVSVYSDVASATDGLKIEQSIDGINWYWDDPYTIKAASGKTFSVHPSAQYLRVRYTNGPTPQGVFALTTIRKKNNSLPSSHRIQDSIVNDDDAQLVKAVLTGENPSGTFINFQATQQGNFKVSLEELENNLSVNNNTQLKITPFDSSGNEMFSPLIPATVTLPSDQYDAFGRLAVAAPHKLFENGATYPIDTVRYHDTSLVGSGTITRNATTTQVELTTTTASGDSAIYQTRRHIQYNKANAQEIFITYRANPTPNRRERWGYFNARNGIFFEHDGTNPRLVIRSDVTGSVVDTKIERADWDDKLDGTGASGKTIDWTKQTVYHIDFGWLSSRGVRFFVDVGGSFVLVKVWHISNMMSVPFMATATLPLRFEITNTGTTAASKTSSFTCMAVQSSGSAVQEGHVRVISNQLTPTSVSSTQTIIGGIRIKSGFIDRGSIQPLQFSLLPATGTTFVRYSVIYNPTLTGASWTTPTDGIYEYLSGTMPTFTGGSILLSGVLSLGNKNSVTDSTIVDVLSDIYIGSSIAGVSDSLVITTQTDTGTGSVFFTGTFKEFT